MAMALPAPAGFEYPPPVGRSGWQSRASIEFRHLFEIAGGVDNELSFTPSDGLRYKGTSNAALVNGENRVTRRVDALGDATQAALVLAALTGVGTLLVWLLRLSPDRDTRSR